MPDPICRHPSRRRARPALCVAALAGAMAGCVAADTPVTEAAPRPTMPTAQAPDDLVRAVTADAAQRRGVDASALQLRRVERVTWPDGSLGCPEPGRMYTMALVPGWRIVLDLRGETLDYHANTRGTFRLCPPGRATDPLPDGGGR